ncbi:MAG: hypothetical protein QM817_37655 [Archangium sp.]
MQARAWVMGLVLISCAPPVTTTIREMRVTQVEVEITGMCTGMPCDGTRFNRNPLKPVSSSFEGSFFRDANGRLVINPYCNAPLALARYHAVRGSESLEGWGGAGDGTFEVNTQYGDSFGDGTTYSTYHSLYAIIFDGTLNFTDTGVQPHDLDPVSNDGGAMVFQYSPEKFAADGGIDREAFQFTEIHRVTSQIETVEQNLSGCVTTGGPYPSGGGFY